MFKIAKVLSRPTKADRDRYLKDMCYVLAIAMHRGTGWPLVAVIGTDPLADLTGRWFDAILHVGVQRPDGKIHDIRGSLTERSFRTFNRKRYKVKSVSEKEVRAEFSRRITLAKLERALEQAQRFWPELQWRENISLI